MRAWTIVPVGTGDLLSRVTGGRTDVGVEVTLFLDEAVARKAHSRFRKAQRDLSEVVEVELTEGSGPA